jgi:hypothetical protein
MALAFVGEFAQRCRLLWEDTSTPVSVMLREKTVSDSAFFRNVIVLYYCPMRKIQLGQDRIKCKTGSNHHG